MDDIDFQTGDIILFNENHIFSSFGLFSYLIKVFTHSNWSHVGMVVKDPEFTGKPLPKGLYLWESSLEFDDAENHQVKLAVQLVPLKTKIDSFKGIIHYRRLNKGNIIVTTENLRKIHKLVHGKPYDLNPSDWLDALFEKVGKPTSNRYFCSALIARIYEYLGFIDGNIDWSIIRPSSFSIENSNDKTHIIMLHGSSLGPEILIKND